VGQFQLLQFIALGADQFLHDLHQHPGGILVVKRGGGAEHLVAKAAQGNDPIVGLAGLKGTEQTGNGVGDPQSAGGGHLLDAMRVHVRGHQRTDGLRPGPPFENIINDAEQLVVVGIKKKPGWLVLHGRASLKG